VQLEAGRIVRDQSSGRYEHIEEAPVALPPVEDVVADLAELAEQHSAAESGADEAPVETES